jgi:mannose-6-phosphate isomerase-like protein (cupin superfamily)
MKLPPLKKNSIVWLSVIICCTVVIIASAAFAKQTNQEGYLLEHEKDLAEQQPGPHKGGGTTTAYNFFSKANGLDLVFRKRVLHPGSSIGYHLQKEDEIYYIVSGTGEMTMNGKTFSVQQGDAILTRPGNWHGLKQVGEVDLVVLVNYMQN